MGPYVLPPSANADAFHEVAAQKTVLTRAQMHTAGISEVVARTWTTNEDCRSLDVYIRILTVGITFSYMTYSIKTQVDGKGDDGKTQLEKCNQLIASISSRLDLPISSKTSLSVNLMSVLRTRVCGSVSETRGKACRPMTHTPSHSIIFRFLHSWLSVHSVTSAIERFRFH